MASDWRNLALQQGKDVNGPEFAAQRAMEQSSGGGAPQGNSSDYIQKATNQITQNMQPGINQLNTGIDNTGAAYDKYRTTQQGNIAPLQERYKAILDSIKGNQTAATNAQTVVTNNELGKRGISGDSGVAQQQVASALQPINAQYSLQGANVGLQEQQDINGINSGIAQSYIGQNTDTNSIRGALASLYGNAATSGAGVGAQLYGTDTQASIAQKNLEAQKSQDAISNALAQQQMAETIRQNTLQNGIDQGQLGVLGGNLGVAQGNLGLNQQEFNWQKKQQDPAYIAAQMRAIGIGGAAPNQSRAPLSSFVK